VLKKAKKAFPVWNKMGIFDSFAGFLSSFIESIDFLFNKTIL